MKSHNTIEEVDWLIRTGREKRLSDFHLFEAAYAELHFSNRLWPDFTGDDLRAVADFRIRDHRFGGDPHDRGARCRYER